ncbi:single-strand DNA endonuclease ASTE1-like [Littorina saxatilis]|uniref:XPG N-terminal domain-containing protein n=1 Tax=Littorina saxatilis TaxID=31220 RepID=A0AAN9BXX9_9CAEN
MGIRGLTSFIQDIEILQYYRLSNCRVVVDGNSLFHFVYFERKVSCQFGGDYDVYQREICSIFSVFKECKIEAYVVFGGAYTVDGKKFKTTIKRAEERVGNANGIVKGDRKDLIPCLAQQTFRQTLDKLGIQHVTCDFEADNQLATLANLWKCPVLSDDSNFYIYDLSEGYIPFKHMIFQPSAHGSSLQVKRYRVDELLKRVVQLNRENLPVFATVLANDYVDGDILSPFHRSLEKRYPSLRGKQNRKVKSVLFWLNVAGGKEDCISQVLEHVRTHDHQRARKLFNDSINSFTDVREFVFNLRDFLEGNRSAADQNADRVTSSRGESLPEWFVTACRHGEIPVSLLNVALSRTIFIPTQVEGASLRPSSKTSRFLRRVAYGLLFGKNMQQADCQSVAEVVEYTKKGRRLQPIKVQKQTALQTSGRIPALKEIPNLGEEERRAILLETLGVSEEFVCGFDPELQLYMACLVFWAKRAKCLISLNHMKAIVLSAILLHVHTEIANRKNRTRGTRDAAQSAEEESCQISIRSVCRSAKGELLEMVSRKLDRYYDNPKKISGRCEADENIFYKTAEFQACVYYAVQLNCLLQSPLATPQPADLFNGSLIYTVGQKMEIRNKPEEFRKKLGTSSPLSTLFDSICSEVVTAAGEYVFTESSEKEKKNEKTTPRRWRRDGVLLINSAYGIEVQNRFWPLIYEQDSCF